MKTAAATLTQRAEAAEARARIAEANLRAKAVGRAGKRLSCDDDDDGYWGSSTEPAYPNAYHRRGRSPRGPVGGSADKHLDRWTRGSLRGQCQHLDRRNGTARMIVDRLVDAVVGGDWSLQWGSSDTKFNAEVERLFAQWWGTTACDHAGIRRGEAIMRTHYRGTRIDGDGAVLMTKFGQLQLVESEQIGGPGDKYGYGNLPEGMITDKTGRLRYFKFAEYGDDGEVLPDMKLILPEWVVYTANLRRASQRRGEPVLSAAMDLLEMLDTFLRSVAKGAEMSADLVLVRYLQNPANASLLPGKIETLGNGSKKRTEYHDFGMTYNLGINEKVEGFQSTQPNPNVPDYVRTMLRLIGAQVGLPLEFLLLDYTQTNFHSAKSAQGQMMAIIAPERSDQAAARSKIAVWKVQGWIDDGTLTGAPEDWARHAWTPPPPAKMDPLKEALAILQLVEGNVITLRAAIEMYGGDWIDVLEQRGVEVDLQDELGITPPGSNPATNGTLAIGADGTGQPGQEQNSGPAARPPGGSRHKRLTRGHVQAIRSRVRAIVEQMAMAEV